MATALPVVATAVGGLPSSVPADCGVLVPPCDEAALGRALGALMRDPSRARAMGESARRHALARFSIDRMTDAYEGLYRRSGDLAPERAAAAEL
jgi:glycosyltransferase involved in cell wall biosynthesis